MSTAIDKIKAKPLTQVTNVKELLWNNSAKTQLQQVAAAHMKPDRMMRVVANAIRTTPTLQEADPLSFLGALMQCAALGLEPNSAMGHVYLVPFKNKRKGITEVQTIIGYKGLKALAWRSGEIDTMHADVVYSDDEDWSYGYGTDTHLRHKPGPQQGEKTHAYCHVKLKDGGQAFVVLPWAHVMRVRDASQNWQKAVRYNKTATNPWATSEDVMAAKTAVRYLFQRGDVPMSIEIADAFEVDHDQGTQVDYAAFAMKPEEGPIIEADVSEIDEDQDKQPQEQEAFTGSDGQQGGEAPEVKKAENRQDKRETDPEAAAGLVRLIKEELAECESVDQVDAVIELYGDQIATLSEQDQGTIYKVAENAGKGAK